MKITDKYLAKTILELVWLSTSFLRNNQDITKGKLKVAARKILLFILLLHPSILWAATPLPNEMSTVQFGSIINTLIQDRDGFFWVGGINGLYKYDGYRFKRFSSGPDSIAGNAVNSIFEDSHGLIWIGSFNGLTVYDKQTDRFTQLLHDPENPRSISSNRIGDSKQQTIIEDQNHDIWIGTENGLNKFNRTDLSFTRYQTQWTDNDIWSLYPDKDSLIWVGTATGLHRFDPQRAIVVETYCSDEQAPCSLRGKHISCIFKDSRETLWVGTMTHGASRMEKGTNKFISHFRDGDAADQSGEKTGVLSILENRDGTIWMATIGNGIMEFDHTTKTFSKIDWPKESKIKEETYFTTILEDTLGALWISSYTGNLYYIHPFERKFNRFIHDTKNPNSLGRGDYLGQVLEDRKGILWMALGSAGIDRYDRTTDAFTHYTMENAGLPEAHGQSLIEDRDGNLWVTTRNHILLFDRKKQSATRVYPAENWPGSPVQDPINPDIIWYGTWGSGLLKFNRKSGETVFLTPDPSRLATSLHSATVSSLYPDGSGMIWLCTRGGGLEKFDPKIESVVARFHHIPGDSSSISSNSVHGFLQDSKGRYWVTTDRGLDRFFPETKTFKRYNVRNGLFPIEAASQIIEDRSGRIWVSGYYEGKIVQFNPESETHKLYGKDDGIIPGIGGSFSPIETRDGTLWFYGGGGIIYFNPQAVKDNEFAPRVYLTSLTQGGEPIETGRALEKTQSIHLDWKHNYFEFEAAALNYYHSEFNRYRYKMSGIDHDWFYANTLRQGRYTGIAPGHYILTIQGSNNDGVWSDKEIRLAVTIAPPWWKTRVFILSTILSAALLLFFGFRWRVAAIQRQKHKLEHMVEEKTRDLNKRVQEIKTLTGLLPICSHCKKIRDDKGYWKQLEAYIEEHSDASFSHSICRECSDKLYGREHWYIEMKKKKGYD